MNVRARPTIDNAEFCPRGWRTLRLSVQCLADCPSELFGIERFGQKEHVIVDLAARFGRFGEITGNKDDFGLRTYFAQPTGKETAAHLRHDQIGQQKMNLTACAFLDQALSIVAIRSFDDLITEVAKNADRHV